MSELIIELPFITPGLNRSGGIVQMNKFQYKEWSDRCEAAVLSCDLLYFKCPVEIKYERYSTGRPMDYDNLVASGKFWLDALKKCGVIVDDDIKTIGKPDYESWQGEPKTVIRIKKRKQE